MRLVTCDHHAVVEVSGPVNESTLPMVVPGMRQSEMMRLPRRTAHMLVVVHKPGA